MAHGNDPSLPHEVAACTTLEVVYEGCTAALACQPISFHESLHRSGRWLDTLGYAILNEDWSPT